MIAHDLAQAIGWQKLVKSFFFFFNKLLSRHAPETTMLKGQQCIITGVVGASSAGPSSAGASSASSSATHFAHDSPKSVSAAACSILMRNVTPSSEQSKDEGYTKHEAVQHYAGQSKDIDPYSHAKEAGACNSSDLTSAPNVAPASELVRLEAQRVQAKFVSNVDTGTEVILRFDFMTSYDTRVSLCASVRAVIHVQLLACKFIFVNSVTMFLLLCRLLCLWCMLHTLLDSSSFWSNSSTS